MAAGDITQALRDRVRSRVGQVSLQGLLSEEIYDHLNRAQYDLVWRMADAAIPELTAIALGSLTNSRVALPSDFCRERQVMIGPAIGYPAAEVPARRWNVTELDALDGNNTMTLPSLTNPYYFIWYNVTDAAARLCVEVGDAASSDIYKLYYVKLPTEVSATADPQYTAELTDLMVDFAVSRCREMRRQFEEAERIWRQYIDRIKAINSRYKLGLPYEGVPGDVPS